MVSMVDCDRSYSGCWLLLQTRYIVSRRARFLINIFGVQGGGGDAKPPSNNLYTCMMAQRSKHHIFWEASEMVDCES